MTQYVKLSDVLAVIQQARDGEIDSDLRAVRSCVERLPTISAPEGLADRLGCDFADGNEEAAAFLRMMDAG